MSGELEVDYVAALDVLRAELDGLRAERDTAQRAVQHASAAAFANAASARAWREDAALLAAALQWFTAGEVPAFDAATTRAHAKSVLAAHRALCEPGKDNTP